MEVEGKKVFVVDVWNVLKEDDVIWSICNIDLRMKVDWNFYYIRDVVKWKKKVYFFVMFCDLYFVDYFFMEVVYLF